MASNPDPGESDSVREPVPGHDQADLSDGKNPVPGQNDQHDTDNVKNPDPGKTEIHQNPDPGQLDQRKDQLSIH